MKGMFWVVVIIAAATFGFIYLTRPPKLGLDLEKSQESATLIARYWLDQAKDDNVVGMKEASTGTALKQCDNMLKEIQKAENFAGCQFSDYSLFSMGGGGSLKAVLTGGEGEGVLMQMTMTMREEEGKWFVSRLTTD